MKLCREIAERWAGCGCTLNGKPAKIGGRLEPFATVATLDGAFSFQWTWVAVNAIMKAGGNFVS